MITCSNKLINCVFREALCHFYQTCMLGDGCQLLCIHLKFRFSFLVRIFEGRKTIRNFIWRNIVLWTQPNKGTLQIICDSTYKPMKLNNIISMIINHNNSSNDLLLLFLSICRVDRVGLTLVGDVAVVVTVVVVVSVFLSMLWLGFGWFQISNDVLIRNLFIDALKHGR